MHFASDEHCSALYYPLWYAQFELAMNVQPGAAYGLRTETFCSVVVPGTHDDGYKLFKTLSFDSVADERAGVFWRAAWAA